MYVAASEKLYSSRIVLRRRLVLLVLSALHQRVAIFRENIFLLVSSFSAEIIQKEERIEILCVCREEAGRRWNPVPSNVGLDLISRLTARIDILNSTVLP